MPAKSNTQEKAESVARGAAPKKTKQQENAGTGYTELLSQLTDVGQYTQEMFEKRFSSMCACPDTYYVIVLEDTKSGQVIGSASMIIEQKFIHAASQRGRVEDVIVDADYRGMQLGKLLIETVSLLGRHLGAYKISFECTPANVRMYEKHGYAENGSRYMQMRVE